MIAGLVVLLLVGLQGLVNGTEVALAQEGVGRPPGGGRDGGQPTAAQTRAAVAALVTTVQALGTGLAVAAGVVAGMWAAPPAAERLADLLPPAAAAAGAAVAVVAAVAAASVMLGEMMPVSVALARPRRFVAWLGPPLWWLSRLGRPLTLLVAASGERLGRSLAEADRQGSGPTRPAVLRELMDEAAAEGVVDPQAAEIAGRALSFGELTVSEVMVPRHRVRALDVAAADAEVRAALSEDGHACIPVFRGTLDEVVGLLVAREALARALDGGPALDGASLRPPFFVPEMMRAFDLLAALKSRELHFAVVIDELGGTVGIVTIEDLLEELVGEIAGGSDEGRAEPLRAQPDGSTLVGGMVPIRDINRALDICLEEGDDWSTLGGLCVRLAGGIPVAGDVLFCGDGRRLEVLDASPRRVQLVRVVPPSGGAPARLRQQASS